MNVTSPHRRHDAASFEDVAYAQSPDAASPSPSPSSKLAASRAADARRDAYLMQSPPDVFRGESAAQWVSNEPPIHCNPKSRDGRYSIDECQDLLPTRPGTPYLRGTGDAAVVDANDVRQGPLGNCYVMASLAAMARSEAGKKILANCIQEVHRNGETIYRVTLRRPLTPEELRQPHDPDRPWKEFVVEVRDRFPDSRALIGDEKDGLVEKWPVILERAIGYVFGGIDRIAGGGNVAKVLPYLTGRPAVPIAARDIGSAIARDEPVAVEVPSNGPPFGNLMRGHAYSVHTVFRGPDGRQYVQLRNPWGHDHPPPIAVDDFRRLDLRPIAVHGALQ